MRRGTVQQRTPPLKPYDLGSGSRYRDVHPPIPTPRGASDGRGRLRLERVLEIRHLLDGAGSLEEQGLGEMVAHELDAHGEPLRQAAGDAYRGNAGEVHGDGAEVLIVHGERVVDLLADPKRHRRRGRGDEHLVARKGFPEVLYYLRAHLLGLGVVSVVVAAGESIGTEHDAPLRLVPEAHFARPTVHLVDTLGSRGPIAVAYPVKAGQVRGDLGGSYDVVGGQPVARVRQAYLPYLGPGAFEVSRDPLDDLAHARLDAFAHQLLYHPDPKARDTAFELCQVIRDLYVRARRVARVVAGDGLQEKSGVAHVTGHRSDLVQGRGERDEPVARDPPIGRLEAHNAAQSGGAPHRTARIRAQGPPTLARGDRRRRAPGGASGHPAEVPGIARRAVGGVLRRGAHRELVAVGLADHDHVLAVVEQRRGVVDRLEVLEYLRAAGRAHAAGREHVLDRYGDTLPELYAAVLHPGIHPLGPLDGEFGGDGDEGVDVALGLFEARVGDLGSLAGGDLVGLYLLCQLVGREV